MLAQSLPTRLMTFFTKYPPPPSILQDVSAATPTSQTPPAAATTQRQPSKAVEIASTTSSSDPNASHAETTTTTVDSHKSFATQWLSSSPAWPINPFAPHRNPATGHWSGPRYGLRQQADLVKLAQQHGVLSLLPPSIKSPEFKERRREELGNLRVKGTGVGQRVKGKSWERTLKGRLEKRRKAMEDMPRMVSEWKSRGHGRGWKKWPK
ncbi:hypothetical protein LTS18_007144 [Coniosporium uncinatum]|uniref:Uncharacterized protein n=1 Tax=Coniosporium uncinatum TaxID=93489 RepID=A0ACC3DPU1_9PEZI|nr:hypothetical protein LTS18_007144 [Coniosporium uncinatum]